MTGVVKKPQSLEKMLISWKLDDGKETKRVALGKDWNEDRHWMHFPPVEKSDDWFEAVSEFEEDLLWLLALPHNKFWSQLVFDPGARAALTSYLQRAPRSYDQQLETLTQVQKEIITRVHNLVFKIYCRLSTTKESDTCFISKEVHGALLYDNYLFDVPSMLDLCLLYGNSERRNVAKLLQSIIKSQPKYAEDLQSTSQMFVKCLKDLEQYFGEQAVVNAEPVKLAHTAPASRGAIGEQQLEDYVLFLTDVVISVSSLIEILPSVLPSFVSSLPEIELSQFYEQSLPTMYQCLSKVADEELNYCLSQKMNIARINLLNVAKMTLTHRINAVISEHGDFNKAMSQTEEYLTVYSECLNCPHFVYDLHSRHPIDCDLKRLHLARPEILDEPKCNYLCDSLISCLESCSMEEPKRKSPSPSELSSSQSVSSKEPTPGPSSSAQSIREVVPMSEDVIMESLISSIQEMLPDLGSGFLKKCLVHYKMDKEAVVNAVLEDSLPAGLKELDRTMPLLPPGLENDECVLPPRLNVFDHDEFDIMSRNHIDKSRVHQGKRKSKHKNVAQLLDDKSDLAPMKSLYASYGTVSDIIYDDEYDDTYDEVKEIKIDDGADPDAERRPFVTPRVLAKKEYVQEDEYSEEEFEENQTNRQDQFVQDPALLRERAQQRREAKYGPPRPQGPPRGDVVGKPKGQGQDSQTQQNRRKKDTNKSSRANHNRRAGAERKLRGGMIPS